MIALSTFSVLFIEYYWLIIAFFCIAILYASVGFGGGSSYTALLSFTGIPYIQFRAIALLCNIVVVAGGTYVYAKHKYYSWTKILPLVVFSIPFAFLGGFIRIEKHFFYILLGLSLIIAAVTMFISKYIISKNNSLDEKKFNLFKNALIGSSIGFISGMVGIGGGVFLAPLLHLTKWDSPKRIAATASFFILVNSIAGLIGQIQNNQFNINYQLVIILMITVFIGGQIGSRLSLKFINPIVLKKLTAVLIGFVGCKILWQYYF